MAPVRQGEIKEIVISGLGHSGEGVGRIEGFTVFVEGALPGETVRCRVGVVKKQYAKGSLLEVLQQAPERVQPPCPVYVACGGCQLQHLSYEGQLTEKRAQVQAALQRIGGLGDVPVHAVLGMEDPWRYRNKLLLPVARGAKGEVEIGCFAPGTHRVVNTEDCLIQQERNNEAAAAVRQVLAELSIPLYDEKTGQGSVRHVLARTGVNTGELMVALVTATPTLPRKTEVIAKLRQRLPQLTSLMQNINNRRTNVVMGPVSKKLWGREYIEETLDGLTFRISPLSFFQVNTLQAQVLYRQALAYAVLKGSETVVDAYCGTGSITLFLARQAAKVYGVDVVAPAIEDAKKNAERNGLQDKATFVTADAAVWMPELAAKGQKADVVVLDPPRAGCERSVLEAAATMRPDRIVYVSCNPASLARDAAILTELGYVVREVQPVDLFPMTHHVECIALIQRRTM